MKFRLEASTLQLLRIKFSFFLMPVYWFALSQVETIHKLHAVLIFIILHVLVYPSSNGYNSYMDRDTGSIGGLKNPMQPTKQLFYTTIMMDIFSILLSLIVSIYFASFIAAYILASRAYSNRTIRLKKYPILGFLITIIFQGAVVFSMVYHGSDVNKTLDMPYLPVIASALLVGSFYPLTQIYQHKEDAEDGVKTMSMLLGMNGTFIFSAIVYFCAVNILAFYFFSILSLSSLYVILACGLPVLAYFFWWMLKVRKDKTAANFKNTMQMNIIASLCTNTGFIFVLMIEKF